MLRVKFDQIKNIVIMEVLEQSDKDTKILKNNIFVASNNFEIRSDMCIDIPDPDIDAIYVEGESKFGPFACCSFNNEEEAKNFVKRACLAIKEYNIKFNPSLPSNECLFTITTIAK